MPYLRPIGRRYGECTACLRNRVLLNLFECVAELVRIGLETSRAIRNYWRMPRKHTRKAPVAQMLYHVFNREKNRAPMFLDDEDRRTFTWMISRYLTPQPSRDARGRPYRNLRHAVRLESMALKSNHFHNGLFQVVEGGVEALMNGAMTSYVRYFNRKYGRDGEMFRGEYRCIPKPDRHSQRTLFAYIHDNHGDDCHCEFCSHRYFVDPSDVPGWLSVDRPLALFGGPERYKQFRQARSLIRAP